MTKLLAAFITFGLLVAGTAAGTAQEEGVSSVAIGLDTPAGWSDADGLPVANVEVTATETSDVDSADGEVVVKVNFTVGNSYSTAIVIKPAGFTLVDDLGQLHTSIDVPNERDSTMFTTETTLPAGESIELSLTYLLPGNATPAVFQWAPGKGLQVIVVLADDAGVANGIGTQLTSMNEDGVAVGSLEIVSVNPAWLDTDGYDGSGYKMTLMEVRYRYTNRTDEKQVIRGPEFSLIDTQGATISSSAEHAPAPDELALTGEIAVAGGESIEFSRIYGLENGRYLAYAMWTPDEAESESGPVFFLVLNDDSRSIPLATPVSHHPRADRIRNEESHAIRS